MKIDNKTLSNAVNNIVDNYCEINVIDKGDKIISIDDFLKIRKSALEEIQSLVSHKEDKQETYPKDEDKSNNSNNDSLISDTIQDLSNQYKSLQGEISNMNSQTENKIHIIEDYMKGITQQIEDIKQSQTQKTPLVKIKKTHIKTSEINNDGDTTISNKVDNNEKPTQQINDKKVEQNITVLQPSSTQSDTSPKSTVKSSVDEEELELFNRLKD